MGNKICKNIPCEYLITHVSEVFTDYPWADALVAGRRPGVLVLDAASRCPGLADILLRSVARFLPWVASPGQMQRAVAGLYGEPVAEARWVSLGTGVMQIVAPTGLSYPTVRKTIDLFAAGG